MKIEFVLITVVCGRQRAAASFLDEFCHCCAGGGSSALHGWSKDYRWPIT